MDNILKYFYFIWTAITSFGTIVLIDDGDLDIYVVVGLLALYAGLYLIVKDRSK